MLNNIAGVLAPTTPLVTNSYESIQTVTVGSGGQATITFTSIPSTFKHLQIRSVARTTNATTGQVNLTGAFNSDTTYTNYRQHYLYGNGANPVLSSSIQSSGNYAEVGYATNANQTSTVSANIVDILDYASTNKYKTVRTLTGADFNGAGEIVLFSSLWMSTSAISSITINTNNGTNFGEYSSFALYGIKG